MCLARLDHKWTALNTSDHQNAFEMHSFDPLAQVVWDAFDQTSLLCSVNANASCRVPDKDVGGKYIINAGCGGCTGEWSEAISTVGISHR